MALLQRVRAAAAAFADPGGGKPATERRIRAIPLPFQSTPTTEQRILNDDTIYSVFNVFSDVLLGAGWRWEGDDAERLQEYTDAITDASGFPALLDEIAASPFQRYAAAEIVWRTDGGGWLPAQYRILPHESTFIDTDEFGVATLLRVNTSAGQQEVPREACLYEPYRPTFAEPLGTSVYPRLKEVLDFKRRTDESIVRFVERFAVPTVIGWYAPSTPKKDQDALLAALKTLQSASVGTLPGPKGDDGNSVDLLEPKTSGNISIAMDALHSYERRLARLVLGSVLAIFESEFGTRAQAETHLEVLKAVLASYQKDIAAPINAQIVKPVLRYNVGEADVQFCLNAPAFDDLAKLGQWVADLAQAGVLDPVRDANAIRSKFGMEELTDEDLASAEADRKAEAEAAAAAAKALPTGPAGAMPPAGAGQ